MKYDEATWISYYKKAVADLGENCKPSSGTPAALAAIRYIRDGVLGDMSKDGKILKDCAAAEPHIRDAFTGLWSQLQEKGVESGFLSNASASAKAAGFKTGTDALSKVVA